MFRKSTRKNGNVPRNVNVFGWNRKRGGAGAVVCALAVALLVVGMAFTVTARPVVSDSEYFFDDPLPTDNTFEDASWEPPQKETVLPEYHGAVPSRLPI